MEGGQSATIFKLVSRSAYASRNVEMDSRDLFDLLTMVRGRIWQLDNNEDEVW